MEEDYTQSDIKVGKGFQNFFDIVESFAYAIVAVVIIFVFFARLSVVDGRSMNDTLADGEYLVVANVFFTYQPENGDIVVVHGNFDNYSDPIVKRVIATENQTVKIDFNTKNVYVDGVLVEDFFYAKYTDNMLYPSLGEYVPAFDGNNEPIMNPDGTQASVFVPYFNSHTMIFEATVPEGHVFVMGDNRNHSADSRIQEIGFVPEEFIVGKAVFRLFPANKMGGLN